MHWLALQWLPEPAPETAAAAVPEGAPCGDALAATASLAHPPMVPSSKAPEDSPWPE